jgi:hypothetical protein
MRGKGGIIDADKVRNRVRGGDVVRRRRHGSGFSFMGRADAGEEEGEALSEVVGRRD